MMSDKIKSFFKMNFSILHVVGIIIGIILSLLYWYKKGQFTDNILKNNVYLIAIWGGLVGYVVFDLVKSALKKRL
ncbi:MAG: hypothetical protein LBU51_10180 [Bacteroidales bacterium]|jgi:prolipoprotein diacylglyceryltransferase|nr:hypothetical protein [Bacteroidales bacterium]